MSISMTVQLNDNTFIHTGVIYGLDEAERMAELARVGAVKRVLVWQFWKAAHYPFQMWDKHGVINCSEHSDFFGPDAWYNRKHA